MKKKITKSIKKLKKLPKKKKFLYIGILIVVIIIGYSIYKKATKPPKYSLEAAKTDSIVELVSETGNVTSAGAVPIYSTTTGMVEEVFVSNGDIVAKGDTLFKVKSTATKLEQDTALSSYMAAKSTLEAAKATQLSLQAQLFTKWDSYKDLAETESYETYDEKPKEVERRNAEFLVPEKEWFAAENAYKNQQQVINQASVQTSAAWQAYQATQDSTVKAHIDGEVRNLGVTKGDIITVPTSLTLATTSPAIILVDEDVNTTIKINVGETDVLKIAEGQSAKVELDALKGKTFSAIVDRVDTVASPTQTVITYAVYIVLDEQVESIRRGMTADVDIVVASKENILTVPASAVKPYEGGKAVRVVDSQGEIEFVPVEVGSRGDGMIEILSGIDEGTEVIVALANDQIERTGGLF